MPLWLPEVIKIRQCLCLEPQPSSCVDYDSSSLLFSPSSSIWTWWAISFPPFLSFSPPTSLQPVVDPPQLPPSPVWAQSRMSLLPRGHTYLFYIHARAHTDLAHTDLAHADLTPPLSAPSLPSSLTWGSMFSACPPHSTLAQFPKLVGHAPSVLLVFAQRSLQLSKPGSVCSSRTGWASALSGSHCASLALSVLCFTPASFSSTSLCYLINWTNT